MYPHMYPEKFVMMFSIEPLIDLQPYKHGDCLWMPSQLSNSREVDHSFGINDLFNSLGLEFYSQNSQNLLYLVKKLDQFGKNSQQELTLRQAGFTRHPATTYVKLALSNKCIRNPEKEHILKKALQHPHITERDLEHSPLKPLEEKSIDTLLSRIIGGCTSPRSKVAAIDELKAFTNSVFTNKNLSHLRGGTLIFYIKNFGVNIFQCATLSANTLRKIIRRLAPETASRRGRSHPNDFYLLKDFVESSYSFKPVGI